MHLDVRQVARGQVQLLVRAPRPRSAPSSSDHSLKRSASSLVFGASSSMTVGDQQALGARQLREHGADGAAVHLAVHLLGEIARLGGEGPAAADPDGRAARAGARLARALLRVRLAAAAAHFGAASSAPWCPSGRRCGTRSTTWCTSASLNLPPKVASDTCSAAPPLTTSVSWLVTSFPPWPGPSTARCRPCRRDGLALGAARGLHGGTHDHLATLGAGHGTADQEQVALEVDLARPSGSRSCGARRPCGRTCAGP